MGYWDKKQPKAPEVEEIDAIGLEELESDVEKELLDVEKSFRERMSVENKRFRDMCDTEYWFCVCFTSREQKDEFLRSLQLNPDEKYIDGKELARAVKRPIKTKDLEFARISKTSKDYLSNIIDEN